MKVERFRNEKFHRSVSENLIVIENLKFVALLLLQIYLLLLILKKILTFVRKINIAKKLSFSLRTRLIASIIISVTSRFSDILNIFN